HERLFPGLPSEMRLAHESAEIVKSMQVWPIALELRGAVQQILTYQEVFPADGEVIERVMPEGTNRLIFNFADIARSEDPGQSGAAVQVVGAWSTPALLNLRGKMDGISVSLLPGLVRAVLGVPAGEISGKVLDLDELWGGFGMRLLDRMRQEPEQACRIRLLEQAILK